MRDSYTFRDCLPPVAEPASLPLTHECRHDKVRRGSRSGERSRREAPRAGEVKHDPEHDGAGPSRAMGLPVIALAAGAGGKRQCICLEPGAVGEVRFIAKLLGVHA